MTVAGEDDWPHGATLAYIPAPEITFTVVETRLLPTGHEYMRHIPVRYHPAGRLRRRVLIGPNVLP